MHLRHAAARPVPLFLMLLVGAVAIRCVQFGNPVVHIDEQFYLLVGDRMAGGALPYVDAWDRKPVGLFLLYAAFAALPGEGILAYQVAATLFAAATAFVVARLAARLARPSVAAGAGLLYLVLLMANGGDGGQSPVFYNLPVALAAWQVVRAAEGALTPAQAGWRAMLLLGAAMQVKYAALFEGAYLGIALMAIAWRTGMPAARLALLAGGWIALALAPTLLAALFYLANDALEPFVFANFVSIFQRPLSEDGDAPRRLWRIVVHVLPVLLPAIVALATIRHWRRPRAAALVLVGWAVTAVGAVLVFGTYHDHYALPLIAPLTIAAAAAFERWRGALALALIAAAVLATLSVSRRLESRGRGADVQAMAGRIAPHAADGLFVFSGDPILYHLTGAQLPTPYLFPTILSERRDRASLGVDAAAELDRVLAASPRFIVTRADAFREMDAPSFARVQAVLRAGYRLVQQHRPGSGPRTMQLWERRDYSRAVAAKP